MRISSTSIAAALLAAVLTPGARADLIAWSAVQNVAGASDVSTDGTGVVAYNCWAQVTSSPTVNGVTFDALIPAEWNNPAWSLNAGSSTGDAGYDSLLDTSRIASGGSTANPTDYGGIRLDTLTFLRLGRTYEIQVWYSDQRLGSPTNILNDRVMTLSSATGNATTNGGLVTNLSMLTVGPRSGALEADPNNLSGPGDPFVGTYCVGTFTRSSFDPLWLLVEGSHPIPTNVLRPHINAFQIREVGLGVNYCNAAANSTGASARTSASGSGSVAQNNLTLEVTSMPLNAFGYFLSSASRGFVQNPGGSQGNLCLGGAIGRYVGPGQIQNSGNSGAIALTVDLTQHPTPLGFVSVQPGETWNFTAWHRDAVGGSATSNFSDGLEISFN